MTEGEFKQALNRARTLRHLAADPKKSEYWRGYERGIRRRYHGESFGTGAEHALFMAATLSPEKIRRALGEGYRAGLRGDTESLTAEALIEP